MKSSKKNIPIKNIFYLLCYAWDVLPIVDDIKVNKNDNDDIYNLLARVFSFGIGRLIHTGFHRSYIEKTDQLSTVKGRINLQQSINNQSIIRKRLICTFDDYSENDIFNQILKYTIDSLIKNPAIDSDTKLNLKKYYIFFNNVKSIPPNKTNRKRIFFNPNNLAYRLLINIAILLFENTSIEENGTEAIFKDFDRKNMAKVFELFILNFYNKHLPKKIYKVHAPKIKWNVDEEEKDKWKGIFDVDDDIGDRRTDVVIENKDKNIQLIIDAKYYYNTFVNAYMSNEEEKIRTSHINQLRGYLADSKYEGKKIGALIYPMVNHDLTNGNLYAIKGHPIIIKTINLNDDWLNIENDMLNFIRKIESGIKENI